MSSFAAALKIDPNNADAHSALARQYERMQRFDDSEAEHMKATTLDPDSMFFHDAYGNFLYNRGAGTRGRGAGVAGSASHRPGQCRGLRESGRRAQ